VIPSGIGTPPPVPGECSDRRSQTSSVSRIVPKTVCLCVSSVVQAARRLRRRTVERCLRREQVYLDQGVVRLRGQKGARAVMLSVTAQKLLRGQLDSTSSEWVFPNSRDRPYSRVHVNRRFRKAARAAGLQNFHFHDLRHHGATKALNAGFGGK